MSKCCACVKGTDMGSDLWRFQGTGGDCDSCCIAESGYSSGKPEESAVCASHGAVHTGTCKGPVEGTCPSGDLNTPQACIAAGCAPAGCVGTMHHACRCVLKEVVVVAASKSPACCTKCSDACAAHDCNKTQLELSAACNCGGTYVAHNHSWSSPCREMCRMNSFCRQCNPAC